MVIVVVVGVVAGSKVQQQAQKCAERTSPAAWRTSAKALIVAV